MLVYNAKKETFLQDVLSNNIEKIILDFFRQKLERNTSQSEIDSWKNSMMYMKNILEDPEFLYKMMDKYSSSGVSLIIGEESGIKNLDECALVFTNLPFWDSNDAHIGLIGSKRMDYARSVPALREVQNSMRNAMRGWN